MTPQQLRAVVRLASDLAEKSADGDGFVSIHRLASTFGAEVEFRPLLVEGVIAKPYDPGAKWKIFIDSETHPLDPDTLVAETSTRPLPARLRNTVAHELAHTLAFRADEFSLSSATSREELVQQLEKDTESLSPVLLVPLTAVDRLCSNGLTADRLASFRTLHSISNEVLIRRFEMLRHLDSHPLQLAPNLNNIAVGLGEWKKGQVATALPWPLFSRFSGVAPSLLHNLKSKQTASLAEVFSDPNFAPNGGQKFHAAASIDAGTSQNPSGDRIDAEIQIESNGTATGTRFLWLLRETRK